MKSVNRFPCPHYAPCKDFDHYIHFIIYILMGAILSELNEKSYLVCLDFQIIVKITTDYSDNKLDYVMCSKNAICNIDIKD